MERQKKILPKKLIFVLMAIVLALASVSPVSAAKNKHLVQVKAKAGWVATKIWLEAGQKVTLKTKGMVHTAPLKLYPMAKSGAAGQVKNKGCGEYAAAPPPCAMNYAYYGALVAKIGNGAPFFIGSEKSFVAKSSGYLFLAVNDNHNGYQDNKGVFNIQLKIGN